MGQRNNLRGVDSKITILSKGTNSNESRSNKCSQELHGRGGYDTKEGECAKEWRERTQTQTKGTPRICRSGD